MFYLYKLKEEKPLRLSQAVMVAVSKSEIYKYHRTKTENMRIRE